MKRILSLILVLVMLLGVMPMASAGTTLEIGVTVSDNVVAGQDYTVTLTAPENYTFQNLDSVSGGWNIPLTNENAVLSADGTTITITYPAGADASGSVDLPAFSATLVTGTGTATGSSQVTSFNVTAAPTDHEHDFTPAEDGSNVTVTTPATCGVKGVKTISCVASGCDTPVATTTVDIPALEHEDTDNDGLCDNLKADGVTKCGHDMNEYTIVVSNGSTTSGSYVLTPVLKKNGTVVEDATFTFTGGATGTGASVTVTGSETIKTVNIAVATGAGDANVSTSAKISFYKDDYDVEVTMIDGSATFKLGNANAVKGNSSLATLLAYCSNSGLSSDQYTFTKISDDYGKFNLYGSFGTRSTSGGNLASSTFTVLKDTYGYWATSFTVTDTGDSNLIYGKGVVTIKFGDVTGAITYKTTTNKTVVFDEDDFDDYWEECGMSGYPEYVMFEGQPFYGDLYTTSAMKTKVTSSDKFYYGATGTKLDLDAVTYDPYSVLSSYDDEVEFAMYGDDAGEVVYGVVVIEVGEKMNFTDVKTSDYFYDAVVWAVGEGITSGTSATTFSPNATCTRAQVVTFLYRAAGEPAVSGSMPFTDVKYTDYYYDAVLWAYKNDITTGLTATTFGPNATVTRGQVVTFLHRALNEPYSGSYNPFTDVKSSDYFADAVLWAYQNDVTTGLTATSFGPNSGCTRGQIVTFLYRAYEGE